MKSIKIPESVTKIGVNPFNSSGICEIENYSNHYETKNDILYSKEQGVLISYFGRHSSVIIPDGICRIGKKAFSSNRYIEYISIPERIKIIEKETFSFCQGLKYIELPEGLTLIDERTFWGCENLQFIKIPETVRK